MVKRDWARVQKQAAVRRGGSESATGVHVRAQKALDQCFRLIKPGDRRLPLLLSLRSWLERRGKLSPKQLAMAENIEQSLAEARDREAATPAFRRIGGRRR